MILGILSLLLSVTFSVFIFVSAAGIGYDGAGGYYAPIEVKSAGMGLIIGVLATIFFFYKHYRGHPEMHLFDADAT